MKRDAIDFHEVKYAHEAIHERCLNWARYVRATGRTGACAPMFRLYRPDKHWHEPEPAIPVDTIDGHKIEREVGKLPEQHMYAIRWSYVYSVWVPLGKACRIMAVRRDTLHRLVEDGRSMLKNRAVDTHPADVR